MLCKMAHHLLFLLALTFAVTCAAQSNPPVVYLWPAGHPTLQGAQVRTIEGLAGAHALHPVQQAWIDEQVPLCGFCQNGMMIKAAELLDKNPAPTVAQIKTAFTTDGPSAHLCRCGSYSAIIEGVQRAATLIAKAGK